MIHPRCSDVVGFLWNHLEKDLHVLGDALDQNLDNTAITVHLVLRICADSERPSGEVRQRALPIHARAHAAQEELTLLTLPKGSRDGGLNLSTPESRQEWERLVCASAISPVLHV